MTFVRDVHDSADGADVKNVYSSNNVESVSDLK